MINRTARHNKIPLWLFPEDVDTSLTLLPFDLTLLACLQWFVEQFSMCDVIVVLALFCLVQL